MPLALLTGIIFTCIAGEYRKDREAVFKKRPMAMISRMHELVEDESQFIIATHSPIIMAYPNEQILLINKESIQPVEYAGTEHYSVTKDFLNRYERFLKELIN